MYLEIDSNGRDVWIVDHDGEEVFSIRAVTNGDVLFIERILRRFQMLEADNMRFNWVIRTRASLTETDMGYCIDWEDPPKLFHSLKYFDSGREAIDAAMQHEPPDEG